MALLKQTQLHCFMHVLDCSEQITSKQRDLVKKKKKRQEKAPKVYLKVLSHEGTSEYFSAFVQLKLIELVGFCLKPSCWA